jgi:hypothetical protein
METDRSIVRVRNSIAQIEAEMKILEAVVGGYELLRNAASREMTRRIGEKAQMD